MSEQERIIRSFSESEILEWKLQFGELPRWGERPMKAKQPAVTMIPPVERAASPVARQQKGLNGTGTPTRVQRKYRGIAA